MSARKRRAVDSDHRSQKTPEVLDSAPHTWCIHPHGSGMIAIMQAKQGSNLAAGSDVSGSCNFEVGAASYIAVSESSPTIVLSVHPHGLPSAKVLGLRLVECVRVQASQSPPSLQLCIVTACDIKREIIVSLVQQCDENTCETLPLLPLLSLSLSNPSSFSCAIADGPTVVFWRNSRSIVGSECFCVQWLVQHWAIHDASLPSASSSVCCFAHCLGPSPEAAAFVFSDGAGCNACIIPALFDTPVLPKQHADAAMQAIAAALHTVLPMSASDCLIAKLVLRSPNSFSNEGFDQSLPLSRCSDCRFMSLQPRGTRSSAVIFTLRTVRPPLSQTTILRRNVSSCFPRNRSPPTPIPRPTCPMAMRLQRLAFPSSMSSLSNWERKQACHRLAFGLLRWLARVAVPALQ